MKKRPKYDKIIVRGSGRIPKEAFHFTIGDELWTIKMRKQAIHEACMEIRLVGGRNLLAHAIEELPWNPLIFLSDVLGVEVFVNIPPDVRRIFDTICCKDCDVDKTMQVFMLFVSRMESTAMQTLERNTSREYKGVLVGNWHPIKFLSKVFKDVMTFYLGTTKDGYAKKKSTNPPHSPKSPKRSRKKGS